MTEKPGTPHPHDLLVRNVLADADMAADFLRNYLAPEWTSALEWDSLQREPGETVAPGLSKLVGDLRYSTRLKGTGEELRVFVFLEHQSQPDRFMTFRMVEYVCAAYRQQISGLEGRRFPYPLAVVLHHGKTPWKEIPPMRDLIAVPPGVSGDILDLPICLVDLAAMPPDQLRGHPMVCALLESLQSASMGVLSNRIRGIFARLRPVAGEGRVKPWATALGKYYSIVQRQVQGNFEILASAFAELFGKKETDEMMMTLAETWEMQGETRGKIASVITVLESRFDSIPFTLKEGLQNMRDDSRIDAILKLAATCRSLEEFQKGL